MIRSSTLQLTASSTSVATRLKPMDVIKDTAKKIAVVALFAASTLGSYYLALKNPDRYGRSLLLTGLMGGITLPFIAWRKNSKIMKTALIIYLTAMASLVMSAIPHIISIALSQNFLLPFERANLTALNILGASFWLTGSIGYLTPMCGRAFKRAYSLIFCDENGSLLKQEMHDVVHWFKSSLCPFSLFNRVEKKGFLKDFDLLLQKLEQQADFLSMHQATNSLSDQQQILKSIIDGFYCLKIPDLPLAFNLLLKKQSTFIPFLISPLIFIDLFDDQTMLEAANDSISSFLDSTAMWQKLKNEEKIVHDEIILLEQDLQNPLPQFSSDQMKMIDQRYERLQQKYSDLSKEVEKLYVDKRQLQDFVALWPPPLKLPFDKSQMLLGQLQDQNLWNDVQSSYHSLFAATNQQTNRNLCDRMTFIRNQYSLLQDDDEVTSAAMFLASNFGFIQGDYDILRNLLKIGPQDDLEQAMAGIGLAVEQDLFQHQILSSTTPLSKKEIHHNLQDYVQKTLKLGIAKRISLIASGSTSNRVSTKEKIARTIYYAITNGLILVPVFLQPLATGTGVALGLGYFGLRRFGFLNSNRLEMNIYNLMFDQYPQSNFNNFFRHMYSSRRLYSLQPSRIRKADLFAKANFFERMHILSIDLLTTLYFCYPSSAFLEGVLLADNVAGMR